MKNTISQNSGLISVCLYTKFIIIWMAYIILINVTQLQSYNQLCTAYQQSRNVPKIGGSIDSYTYIYCTYINMLQGHSRSLWLRHIIRHSGVSLCRSDCVLLYKAQSALQAQHATLGDIKLCCSRKIDTLRLNLRVFRVNIYIQLYNVY